MAPASAAARRRTSVETLPEDPRTLAMERQADALQLGAEARQAQAHAAQAQADAWNRVADMLEKFIPAAETIHGFAGRLDKVCKWLKSGWPWLFGLAILIMMRLVAADPAKAPTVIAGFIELMKALI